MYSDNDEEEIINYDHESAKTTNFSMGENLSIDNTSRQCRDLMKSDIKYNTTAHS